MVTPLPAALPSSTGARRAAPAGTPAEGLFALALRQANAAQSKPPAKQQPGAPMALVPPLMPQVPDAVAPIGTARAGKPQDVASASRGQAPAAQVHPAAAAPRVAAEVPTAPAPSESLRAVSTAQAHAQVGVSAAAAPAQPGSPLLAAVRPPTLQLVAQQAVPQPARLQPVAPLPAAQPAGLESVAPRQASQAGLESVAQQAAPQPARLQSAAPRQASRPAGLQSVATQSSVRSAALRAIPASAVRPGTAQGSSQNLSTIAARARGTAASAGAAAFPNSLRTVRAKAPAPTQSPEIPAGTSARTAGSSLRAPQFANGPGSGAKSPAAAAKVGRSAHGTRFAAHTTEPSRAQSGQVALAQDLSTAGAQTAVVLDGRAEIAPQIATLVQQHVPQALASGRAVLRVTLNPPSLGHISISLSAGEGGITAVLRAEQPVALQLMQQAQPEIRRRLAELGLGAAQVQVSGFAEGSAQPVGRTDPDGRRR